LTQVFGYNISNPIGISAGLDKHADVPDALFDLGPAIVEVGGTTPLPQDGNPKPRVFRVPSQNAMINRYGLNSKGADHMAAVLKQRVVDFAYAAGFGLQDQSEQRVLDGEANVPPGSLVPGKLLAVQVAKNKLTPDSDIEAIKRDYVYCVDRVARYADILVVNVSSPNTPGLRDLQAVAPLTAILTAVVGSAKSVERKTKPYVMVKVSPDEDSHEQISGICEAVWNSGVDGVIVGNTTNRRPDALPKGFILSEEEQKTLKETGGYSGPQLFDNTVALVGRYRALLDQGSSATEAATSPRKVIFASGGITTGQQAQAALNAGASVAMMYTGITYGGIGTVTRVKQELRKELNK
jgi:dihydroorotate dehydrogenase